MKRMSIMNRRWRPMRSSPMFWGAVLAISLLLCGAGPSTLAAASDIPVEDDRAAQAVAPGSAGRSGGARSAQ